MEAQLLSGGFSNAPHQSAIAFRAIMNAMARPGTIETLIGSEPPNNLSHSAGTLLLTLCDPETPIFLAGQRDCAEVRDWLVFHTGARFVRPDQAMFAIGTWEALMPITQFAIGDAQYPDRSTSVIVEQDRLTNNGAVMRGPGIETEIQFNLPETEAFQNNAKLFPLGCDFYFTSGDKVAALPRTSKIEAA